MVYLRGRGLVENEEQDENKKMKSIVVEEQEQEQEQEEGSETRFVDLDEDTLRNVLGRVDVFTLGRAACVNTLWREVANDNRFWELIYIRYMAGIGGLRYINRYRTLFGTPIYIRHLAGHGGLRYIDRPPPDFYSIDFSEMITPWV